MRTAINLLDGGTVVVVAEPEGRRLEYLDPEEPAAGSDGRI